MDDEILDALASGATIRACVARFGVDEREVQQVLKAETNRMADGQEMRSEWMLASRRLREVEIKFHNQAVANMDCQAAVVSIKANERRATLNGANAPTAQAVTIMNQVKETEQPSSTVRMLEAIRRLKEEDPDREEREAFEQEWQARKEAAARRQSDDPDQQT